MKKRQVGVTFLITCHAMVTMVYGLLTGQSGREARPPHSGSHGRIWISISSAWAGCGMRYLPPERYVESSHLPLFVSWREGSKTVCRGRVHFCLRSAEMQSMLRLDDLVEKADD